MKQRTEIDSQKYNSIDLTKFICALIVITGHVALFGETEQGSLFSHLNYGFKQYLARFTVPFFFISSGYFLYRKTTYPSFSLTNTKKYVVRIIKLYLLWSIIYLPIVLEDIIKRNNSFLCSLVEYIRDLILVGSYNHLWYLNGLIIAVCLTSIFLYKKIKPLKISCVALILFIFGLFGESWFGFITPIRESSPPLWRILKLIGSVIITTRNGFFFGFLFVSLGMLFAYYDIEISKKKAAILSLISMLLMLVEVIFLESKGYIRAHDMYLFQVPSVFFLFCFIKQVKLPDNKHYIVLRSMSALIYFTHLWIRWLVDKFITMYGINAHNSPIRFVIILIITLAVSYSIYALSRNKRFGFLKKLYA